MDQAILEQVEKYLQHLESDISASPNTVAAYRNDLSQLSQYLLTASSRFDEQINPDGASAAKDDWSSVSRARLVGFVVSLKEKGYAATTVARKIAALKSY